MLALTGEQNNKKTLCFPHGKAGRLFCCVLYVGKQTSKPFRNMAVGRIQGHPPGSRWHIPLPEQRNHKTIKREPLRQQRMTMPDNKPFSTNAVSPQDCFFGLQDLQRLKITDQIKIPAPGFPTGKAVPGFLIVDKLKTDGSKGGKANQSSLLVSSSSFLFCCAQRCWQLAQ